MLGKCPRRKDVTVQEIAESHVSMKKRQQTSMTYGRLPRNANNPNFSPSDHFKNISASIRALSL